MFQKMIYRMTFLFIEHMDFFLPTTHCVIEIVSDPRHYNNGIINMQNSP